MLFGVAEGVYSLSQEQQEFYRSKGYLILEKLFSEEECGTILKSVRQHANEDFAPIMNPDREEELGRQAPFSSTEKVRETATLLRNFMKNPRSVSILETLQGKEVVGLMSQMLFKEVGTRYALQAWNPHQDNTYARNLNQQYLTTNLFLADADKENGGLYIYPGSHREGLLPAAPTVSYREPRGQKPGNPVKLPTGYKKVDLVFRKGDFIVLHGDCVHGSYANTSKTRSRPLYSCSYLTKGEAFLPGNNAKRMVILLH